MRRQQSISFLKTASAAAFLCLSQSARPVPALAGETPEIAVILSGELSPYQKAWRGIEKALAGRPVTRYVASQDKEIKLPENIRVVVTFGNIAARTHLPGKAAHITAITPSMPRNSQNHPDTRIEMLPEAVEMISDIRRIQPELRVLIAFWASETARVYIKQLAKAGKTAGLEVRSYETQDGGQLLLALKTSIVAGSSIWIPPDSSLINSENFGILRRYSRENAVPLYVPTEGLAANGGTISISAGFEEIGRAAGETAVSILEGRPAPDIIYPGNVETVINAASAAQCGINISRLKLPGLKIIH